MPTETINSFQKVQVPGELSFLSARVTFALGEKMVQKICIIQIVFKGEKQTSKDSNLDSSGLEFKKKCICKDNFQTWGLILPALPHVRKKPKQIFFPLFFVFWIMLVFARLASWRFCITAKNPPIFQTLGWGKECGVRNLPALCSAYTVGS